jgi:hypothetical protein
VGILVGRVERDQVGPAARLPQQRRPQRVDAIPGLLRPWVVGILGEQRPGAGLEGGLCGGRRARLRAPARPAPRRKLRPPGPRDRGRARPARRAAPARRRTPGRAARSGRPCAAAGAASSTPRSGQSASMTCSRWSWWAGSGPAASRARRPGAGASPPPEPRRRPRWRRTRPAPTGRPAWSAPHLTRSGEIVPPGWEAGRVVSGSSGSRCGRRSPHRREAWSTSTSSVRAPLSCRCRAITSSWVQR